MGEWNSAVPFLIPSHNQGWNWTSFGGAGPRLHWLCPFVLINSDRWHCHTESPEHQHPDCCQHPLKAHKNKLSIGLPVGKIDSVHPTVADISNDRGAYHVPVIGSNSWTGI
jgi:hypothetical protein